MVSTTDVQYLELIADLRNQIAELSKRVAQIESAPIQTPAPEPAPAAAPDPGIPEEEILAISAALAAWLGVRVHIKQIRLIGSRAWAQEGRVSIQASHRLHS